MWPPHACSLLAGAPMHRGRPAVLHFLACAVLEFQGQCAAQHVIQLNMLPLGGLCSQGKERPAMSMRLLRSDAACLWLLLLVHDSDRLSCCLRHVSRDWVCTHCSRSLPSCLKVHYVSLERWDTGKWSGVLSTSTPYPSCATRSMYNRCSCHAAKVHCQQLVTRCHAGQDLPITSCLKRHQ